MLVGCGDANVAQFGPVQQVQIDEGNKDGVVYVKFESVMSALNVSLLLVFWHAHCL
jgi:hypothetical protein